MKKSIFLTGSTGLVGGNLLPLLLKDTDISKLYLLVRGKNYTDAREKVYRTIKKTFRGFDAQLVNDKVEIFLGDVSSENLDFSNNDYKFISEKATHIIHSAANVSFLQSDESARKVNYHGTKNVMKLAFAANSNGNLKRVAYVSTAYVFGNQSGTFFEDQSYKGSSFANSYERSKSEADSYVRSLFNELPLTIFRPSIIVGNSYNGVTTAFNVLYVPLELIFRGLLNFIPGHKNTLMDVVPVDFVVNSISKIFFNNNDSIGSIFHLTSGKNNSITAGEIIELAMAYAKQTNDEYAYNNISKVKFVSLNAYHVLKNFVHGSAQKLYNAMEIFAPYLSVKRLFDNHNTEKALKNTGITIPSFKDFYYNLFDYCVSTNWGKSLKNAA